MKKFNLIIITLLLSAIVFSSCSSGSSGDTTAQPAAIVDIPQSNTSTLPSFQLYDQRGQQLNLNSFRGKKVFVNFWATWCPPCRAEMPSIEKLYAAIDTSKTVFVMLSFDEAAQTAVQYVRQNKLTMPIYFPAENPPAIFQTDGIPATFIFDEQGNLLKRNIGGEDYNTDEYRAMLSTE